MRLPTDAMQLNQPNVSTRRALCSTARQLYARAPLKVRALLSFRPLICPFEELLAWVPPDGRVLDIGCGAGLFLGLIGSARPRVSALGFDADQSAIAVAQTMVSGHFDKGRIRFEQRTIQEQWSEDLYDVVSMIDVLHHVAVSDQRLAVEKAFRRVVPGGVLVYKDMAERPIFHAWWNRLHDLVLARQWIHYRAIADVSAWLREGDAEILVRSTTLIGPYAHEIIVARRRSSAE